VTISPLARVALRIATALTLVFIWTPLAIVALYAFNDSRIQAWPLDGFTTEWFRRALDNPGARDAFLYSLKVALGATVLALAMGTLLSLAVARHHFFGRETLSFLVILPIALPGIVTGMALNATFNTVGISLGLITIVIGHATFCIVLIYNNAVARLRRVSEHLEEASADLGANTWQTFRLVTLPSLRSAMLAGALLAFALSFDEIIVTTFTAGGHEQTLPIWIFQNLFRPNQTPVVNVVAAALIVLSAVPIWLAQRLGGDEEAMGTAAP